MAGSKLYVGFVFINTGVRNFHALNIQLSQKVRLAAKEQTEHIIVSGIPEGIYIFSPFTFSHILVPNMLGDLCHVQFVSVNLVEGAKMWRSLILGNIILKYGQYLLAHGAESFHRKRNVTARFFHLIQQFFCLREIYTFCKNIDVDKELQFPIPIGCQLTIIFLTADGHSGGRILNIRYNIVCFEAGLIKQRRQLNRMNDIHCKHNSLDIFLLLGEISIYNQFITGCTYSNLLCNIVRECV